VSRKPTLFLLGFICGIRKLNKSRGGKVMQVLVMYYSKTGNTKKLAQAIAKGVQEVPGVQCVLKPVLEVTKEDFLTSDGIIAGSPVYFGTMAAELKEVFDKFVGIRGKMGDKVGAAFATAGDPSGGKETTIISILQAMLINGMIIVGDPLDATGHYGTSCVGAPDKKTELNAKKLGKRVAELVKKLKG
jgi:NAD(P)H dehydrogenase (quinone)